MTTVTSRQIRSHLAESQRRTNKAIATFNANCEGLLAELEARKARRAASLREADVTAAQQIHSRR